LFSCLQGGNCIAVGWRGEFTQHFPPPVAISGATDGQFERRFAARPAPHRCAAKQSPAQPERVWPARIQPYARSQQIFQCPSAPYTGFPSNWAGRGLASIGYTTATAYDPAQIEGFPTMTRSTLIDTPTRTALFGDTANGPTEEKYRGYVFDPYNGPAHATDPRLGTPLIADRDLVKELSSLPPAALKPMFARHFANGANRGRALLVFADCHAKTYSAASILAQEKGANIIWRFRPKPSLSP